MIKETLIGKYKRERRVVIGNPSLASLEALVSEEGKTFGATLSAALDKFFENSESGQERKIKVIP